MRDKIKKKRIQIIEILENEIHYIKIMKNKNEIKQLLRIYFIRLFMTEIERELKKSEGSGEEDYDSYILFIVSC